MNYFNKYKIDLIDSIIFKLKEKYTTNFLDLEGLYKELETLTKLKFKIKLKATIRDDLYYRLSKKRLERILFEII